MVSTNCDQGGAAAMGCLCSNVTEAARLQSGRSCMMLVDGGGGDGGGGEGGGGDGGEGGDGLGGGGDGGGGERGIRILRRALCGCVKLFCAGGREADCMREAEAGSK